jgi:hypothetical protein
LLLIEKRKPTTVLSQEEAEWVLTPRGYFIQEAGSIAADSLVDGVRRVVENREKPTVEGRRKLETLVPEGFSTLCCQSVICLI